MRGSSLTHSYSLPRNTLLTLFVLILLTACRLEPNPPQFQAAPDISGIFATPEPELEPVIVAVATRLPTIAPSPTPSPPTATPTIPPTATATATPEPTITPSPTPTNIPCTERGQIAFGTYTSRIEGPTRRYRVYLPPCYGQDGYVYPTIYMLHGNIRADNEWDEAGLDDAAELLITTDQIPPFLIVMPDGYTLSDTSSGGAWSYEDIVVNELIPHIEETWCAAAAKDFRAIGGLSRGGYWSFQIAFRHPDLFESAASHSGSFLDVSNDITINPLYTATRNDLTGLRIAMDYGADDWSKNTGIPLHEDLLAAGIPHKWNLYDFGGHDDPYWRSHAEEYLKWYSENWSFARHAYAPCKGQP